NLQLLDCRSGRVARIPVHQQRAAGNRRIAARVGPQTQGRLWPKQGPSTSKLDRRVSDQKAAKELANIIRQLRVESVSSVFR
ncbi:MAG: hypothetical protein WCF00_08935, partial [Azonexus sp.]